MNKKQDHQLLDQTFNNVQDDRLPEEHKGSPDDYKDINDQTGYLEQPSQITDISRYLLNVTAHTNQNLLTHPNKEPPLFENTRSNFDSTNLLLKRQGINNKGDFEMLPIVAQNNRVEDQQEEISQSMQDLKYIIDNDDGKRLLAILRKDIPNHQEALMYLYTTVLIFSAENEFDNLLQQNNYFEFIPEWNLLLCQPRIFQQIQDKNSTIERKKFEYIALKVALEKELFFMTEIILSKAVFNKQIIALLLSEDQKKLLLEQLFKPNRPKYFDINQHKSLIKPMKGIIDQEERYLHFNDIIIVALDGDVKSKSIIKLIKLMKNELVQRKTQSPETELNYKELYKVFVQKRKIKLLRYLFSLPIEFNFNANLFIEALELEAYDIASLLYKEFFRKIRSASKDNEYIITILLSSLNKNNGMIEFKTFLLRQYLEQFMLRHAKQFLDTMESKFSQDNKQNLLVLNLNTVKTACLLIELLEMTSNKFDQLRVRCQTIRIKVIKLGQQYMKLVEQEREMRFLLLEKDFENRDSLDLISKYCIQEFLESQYAENVVKEIWRSPYATNNNIFSASTNHNLTFNFNHCVRDEEIEKRFYKDQKELKTIEAHPLQFTVWRYSGKSRVIIDFVATVIMAIIMHYFIWVVLNQADFYSYAVEQVLILNGELKAVQNQSSALYLDLSEQITSKVILYDPYVQNFYKDVMIVSYLSFLCLMFALQHIADIVYASLNKKWIDPYSIINIIDLSIFTMYITNILVTYARNLQGTWQEKPALTYDEIAWIYAANYERGYVSENGLWICCIIILWIRAFYIIRYNEDIGKFVAILERLLYEVFIFFCCYLIELVFFALAADLCFRDLPKYNTVPAAFKTLFYSSFGQFEFEYIGLSQYGPYFGYTYMIIFLIVNIGLVMNMFISIINVLWDSLSGSKNIFQMLETLKIRPQTQADKDYSSLVSLPTPLNAIHFFAAPFLLTSKDPEPLNEFLLLIAYSPILFVAIIIFIIYNLILWPFAYMKLFFHKLIMIMVYSKSFRVSRADKFMNFVIFIIIGPFVLFINIGLDTYIFVRHMLLKDLYKIQHKTSDQSISKDNLKLISTYFKQRNEKMMPYKQVATDIREKLQILQTIVMVLRPRGLLKYYNEGDKQNNLTMKIDQLAQEREKEQYLQNQDEMFSSIKEFSTLKQIFERNSEFIKVKEGVRVKSLDCKVLSILMTDLMRHSMILKVEDENYIFIRRALNVRQKSISKKSSKYQEDEEGEDDEEDEDEIRKEKRLKITFKRFLFMNTTRMMQILKYSAPEGDRKRLINSIKQAQEIGQDLLNISLNSSGDFGKIQYVNGNGSKRSIANNIDDFETRVFEMGQAYPKLNTALQQMRHEISNLMNNAQNQKLQGQPGSSQDKEYQAKVQKLIQDLEHIKDDKTNVETRKNVIVDYFYNDPNKQKQQQFQSRDSGKKYTSVQMGGRLNAGMSPKQENSDREESDVPDVNDDDDDEDVEDSNSDN